MTWLVKAESELLDTRSERAESKCNSSLEDTVYTSITRRSSWRIQKKELKRGIKKKQGWMEGGITTIGCGVVGKIEVRRMGKLKLGWVRSLRQEHRREGMKAQVHRT